MKSAAVQSSSVLRDSQVPWRRIVLDEAHSIKDRRCNTAKAVFALDSQYKWALSGTPLQVSHAVALSHCQPWQSLGSLAPASTRGVQGHVTLRHSAAFCRLCTAWFGDRPQLTG